ncbi:SDR family NAD(P)-dependent oxidoreductase [Ramlibacter sp.]|uniref:SDR family NAD(P)-dependent oxidoreductase n=1 Tax=Ramlibacter sp. TaxID=1917967 RepID=UPI003D0A2FA7
MAGLQGKVAFITGSTGGIGRGAALRLAARGANIVVNGRDPAKGAAVVAEIEKLGAKAIFAPGDALSKEDMDRVCAEAARVFGGIDMVVSNAGARDNDLRQPDVRGPFRKIDLLKVTKAIADTTLGKLQPVQSALPYMADRGGGSVVFVASEGGRVPTPGQTGTSTWAGGLIMSTKVLAKELAKDRIRVNCVCVTIVRDTPSWDLMSAGGLNEQNQKQYEKIESRSPLGVAGSEDIGSVIAFLATDDSKYITGATVSSTGGLTLS